jgi:hypothetical protein
MSQQPTASNDNPHAVRILDTIAAALTAAAHAEGYRQDDLTSDAFASDHGSQMRGWHGWCASVYREAILRHAADNIRNERHQHNGAGIDLPALMVSAVEAAALRIESAIESARDLAPDSWTAIHGENPYASSLPRP